MQVEFGPVLLLFCCIESLLESNQSNCFKQQTSRHAFLGVLCSFRYAQLLTTIFVTLFGAQRDVEPAVKAIRFQRLTRCAIENEATLKLRRLTVRLTCCHHVVIILSHVFLFTKSFVPLRLRASLIPLFSSGFTVRVCHCCTSWPQSSCVCSLSAELCSNQCQKRCGSELSEKQ